MKVCGIGLDWGQKSRELPGSKAASSSIVSSSSHLQGKRLRLLGSETANLADTTPRPASGCRDMRDSECTAPQRHGTSYFLLLQLSPLPCSLICAVAHSVQLFEHLPCPHETT